MTLRMVAVGLVGFSMGIVGAYVTWVILSAPYCYPTV